VYIDDWAVCEPMLDEKQQFQETVRKKKGEAKISPPQKNCSYIVLNNVYFWQKFEPGPIYRYIKLLD
jgi:hypothetical protein